MSQLDLDNIQGDILSGLPKKAQSYIIFEIRNVELFKRQLKTLIPHLTTTSVVLKNRQAIADNKRRAKESGQQLKLLPMAGVNIAFSQKGLTKLGITDNINDAAFVAGQKDGAEALGDVGSSENSKFEPDWDPAFKIPEKIHGVFIVAGDCQLTVDTLIVELKIIFGVGLLSSIHILTTLVGATRPDKESGHEHFGFLDGISNPAVKDVDTKPNPGQETVRQGRVLLGREGDETATGPPTVQRPSWALDGSFLVFRYLFQRVPEFNDFLAKNPIPLEGLTKEEGSELLGARLVGRWRSGAPVDIAPFKDDPELGADSQRNNNFRYAGESTDATKCPFGAHLRKTNPRADLEDRNLPTSQNATEGRRIIRRGIQFGPEVTDAEKTSATTQHGRGLLFACYQSNIVNGFQFIQQSWANSINFPPDAPRIPAPGFDPIIGQVKDGNVNSVRTMAATDPRNLGAELSIPSQFVVSRGGEYFFSPSLEALRTTFVTV